MKGIGIDDYPQQSDRLHSRVEVCFHYDVTRTIKGTIVRDDREDPCETIIRTDDGRYLRSVECQYSFVREDKRKWE